jgi:hypothetical protein
MRVSRLIDGGQSAMLAATTFAELGDIDALRACAMKCRPC